MRTLTLAALVVAAICGGCKEDTVQEIEATAEVKDNPSVGWVTLETPAPEYPGYVIGSEVYKPPPEVGYEITITAMADGRFKVVYEGTGMFDYTTYYVKTLGEIRATPEAMDRAGYKGEPFEVTFQ